MTDDQLHNIMVCVWAHPDCPVRLAAEAAEHPWGPPIPWPRERVDIPRDAGPTWRHLCSCRGGRIAVPDELAAGKISRPIPRRIVPMAGRSWVLNVRPEDPPRTAAVYLGQCQDCGRIYWAAVGIEIAGE